MAEITIKDIAKECGVGVSTVSRAINNHPDINPETKKMILEVIDQTGFIPNNSARNLKRTDAKCIAVLVKGITNPLFSGMIKSIEEETQRSRYALVLRHVEEQEDEIDVALELEKEKRLRGIVFLGGLFEHTEEKLENLQSLLEKKLSQPIEEKKDEIPKDAPIDENLKFVKMIYSILLENEVDEKYVNQIMDEVEKVMKKGASVDYILSSIYQKMILKFGQPQPIKLSEHKPKVVFFVGPTGVGKTTTIAKIASRFKVEKGKKVALYTADTYRIAAAEQLRTYANILDTPLNIVYSSKELNEELEKAQAEEFELILVDTAGFSHKNEEQQGETKELIDQVPEEFDKDVYLVLSATTKYRDLMEIADVYKENFDFKMIFTKLDETSCYGNILNMKLYTGTDLSYTTYGQNVPEDIEIFNTQSIVKLLLGGK